MLCHAMLCYAMLRCNALRCADLSVLWSGIQPVAKGTLTSLLDDTGCLSGSSLLSLPARTDPICKAAFLIVVSSGSFCAKGFLCDEGFHQVSPFCPLLIITVLTITTAVMVIMIIFIMMIITIKLKIRIKIVVTVIIKVVLTVMIIS